MDTFLQFFIGISSFDLFRKHFTKIEQRPLIPKFIVLHLHFHVDLQTVQQPDPHVQDPQLITRILPLQMGRQQFRILDLIRRNPQDCRAEPLSHLWVFHQAGEAYIDRRTHDKIIVCCLDRLHCLRCFRCFIHSDSPLFRKAFRLSAYQRNAFCLNPEESFAMSTFRPYPNRQEKKDEYLFEFFL